MLRNAQVQERIAWLQGSTADQITGIRDLARQYTTAAVETLVSMMGNADAPAAARIAAANGILDRGWGKATRYIEAEINFIDRLTDAEQRALLAALDSIPGDEDETATRH